MADPDDEIIDQNDIDKLLEASSVDNSEDTAEDELGELSQNDIDALMDSGPMVPTSSSEPLDIDDEEEEEDYELELISQDDINKLVGKKQGNVSIDSIDQDDQSGETAVPEQVNEEPVIQEEVQVEPAIQEPQPEPAAPIEKEEGMIDESEAVSAEECLVSQENLDQLLSEYQETGTEPEIMAQESTDVPIEEEVLAQEEQVSEPAANDMEKPDTGEDLSLDPKIEPEQEVAMEEDKNQEDVMEDTAPDKTIVDLDDGEKIEEEELQTDIDSLLDDPGDDAGDDDWEQDSLISQDDIEELIKSSENEDEDALGDLDSLGSIDGSNTDGDDFGDDSGNETNDDQEITKEDVEDEDPGAEDSKVILEESGESSSPEKPGKKTKKKKKRKGSTKIGKKLIIILLILLFVSILSLAGYFFLKKDDKNLPQQQIVTKTVLVEKPMIESVEINVDENSSKSNQAKMSKPVSDDLIVEPLIMKDFIILAPETIEGLSYIQVDINIDYSNDSAYYEIKENMPFYRDIVYSSVQKALDSNKGDKITEPDLLQIVQKALIKALPEGSIKKVSFKSFKAG